MMNMEQFPAAALEQGVLEGDEAAETEGEVYGSG